MCVCVCARVCDTLYMAGGSLCVVLCVTLVQGRRNRYGPYGRGRTTFSGDGELARV